MTVVSFFKLEIQKIPFHFYENLQQKRHDHSNSNSNSNIFNFRFDDYFKASSEVDRIFVRIFEIQNREKILVSV